MKKKSFGVKFLTCGLGLMVFANLAGGAPTLPNINTNNVIDITTLGASPDFDNIISLANTIAISNAIAKAASGGLTNGLVGGTVKIPGPGTYSCGPLTLANNVNLQIDAGATLAMFPMHVYTNIPSNVSGEAYGSLIYASGRTNLEISGSGTIDGQGLPWWSSPGTVFANRPYMIYFNSSCKQVLVKNVTIRNAPAQLLVFKGNKTGNITIQNITENAPPSSGVLNPSHNTDGIDLVGTNGLVQNCNISVGDDNIALGTSSGVTANILVTNCAFGTGHGVSIGSHTEGGVSNLTVINCTFSDTDNGIRLKSDNTQGGMTQNINYYNIGMTNIHFFPIIIYSYYNSFGTPTKITPITAQQFSAVPVVAKTPIWRNITISNLTATVNNGGIAGILWGRTEMAISNVVMSKIKITAPQTFDVYNAYGIQFVDSQITVPSTNVAFTIYNGGVTFTNSVLVATPITLRGLAGINSLALYKSQAYATNTDAIGFNPITLNSGRLIMGSDLSLSASTAVNFTLGENIPIVGVSGNLAFNGSTLNITNGNGFGVGSYPLFTYAGSLSDGPVLGSLPTAFTNYTYNLINTPGLISLIVSSNSSPATAPRLGNVGFSGNNLQISGTGGPTNGFYYVLASTNLALPGSNWTRLMVSYCDDSGLFTFTGPIDTNSPQRFYKVQLP